MNVRLHASAAIAAIFLAAAFSTLAGSASGAEITGAIYQDGVAKTCSNAATCDAEFPVMDTGLEFMIVERVTCNVVTNSAARLRSMRTGVVSEGSPTFGTGQFLGPLEELEPAGAVRTYNVNSATVTIVFEGESPLVRVQMAVPVPTIIVACHLFGRLVE